MNTPKVRFKDFTEDWKIIKLDSLISFNNGINAEKDSYGHGRKFINVLDILNNNFIKYNDIIGSVSVSEKIEETNKVEYGDLLFLRSSETREDVGKSSVYLDEDEFALFGGFVIRGKKQVDYHPYFLKLNLESSKVRNQISSKAGGSTRFNVSQSILSSIEISIPSQNEQRKIADFIGHFDKRLQLQQEKIDLLKEQKKGYMQKIFSWGLRFKDENGLEYPKWEQKKIADIATVTMGQSPNSDAYSINPEDTVLIQGNADLKNGKIIPRIYTSEITKTCEENDIILTVRAPVGMVAKSNINACIGRGVCAIKADDFLYYYLEFYNNTSKWDRLSQGSTFESVNSNDIKSIIVPEPNVKEKKKISQFLNILNKKVELEEKKLEGLLNQKQAFMQQMFI
ncbi:restriction endonuclease subunit S [Paenibacillus bouchesdurhonensis]|uniref:restriction endonuclease subunit S n=1 Tax=Paenibacillus bouchesdurhonensis TaxID=1870990 RepID=UPI000DA609B4|nr:restriction endonuclease subunit S [Paenibacillus bouchesdurhonensis]